MALRGDEVGLFWDEPPRLRRVAVEPTKRLSGPVMLNPYTAREPLVYELMSRQELIDGAGGMLVFDIECFKNFFLIAFKSLANGKVVLFELPDLDNKKLTWIMQHYTCIGFNSIRYDLPLLWLACVHPDPEVLKSCSNDLFQRMRIREIESKYGFTVRPTTSIDLIEVCPLIGSLKLYGARLHAKRIQDVPWGDQEELEDWQVPITRDYCINDLDSTALLYANLAEQLQLRRSLSDEYHQDFMSKSDAQIAEEVIGKEMARLTGGYPKRPSIVAGTILKYQPPANLYFQSEYMQEVLATVGRANFAIDETGYIIRPEEIKKLQIKIGNNVYRMGIGGLHSSEKSIGLQASETHLLFDRDVASYYPTIVLNCELFPKHLGKDFLTVYKNLVERRLEAKSTGNIAISENLKVAINGTFGKTGSPHSILYAPEMTIQITVGGQLYLLMLIERLETVGVSVVSANTDGFVVLCPRALRTQMLEAVKWWEVETGFVTEETEYKALYSRDVNAYLAVKMDGGVKGKNVFYDPWRSTNARDLYWRFQKNPSCQICVEAIEKWVTEGISVEDTVRGCLSIQKFVAIKNVNGGAHKNGDYLGKVVRWYYASSEAGTINYIENGRIVGDTQGAKPIMDLPETLPEDVDYSYYIQRTLKMMATMGLST